MATTRRKCRVKEVDVKQNGFPQHKSNNEFVGAILSCVSNHRREHVMCMERAGQAGFECTDAKGRQVRQGMQRGSPIGDYVDKQRVKDADVKQKSSGFITVYCERFFVKWFWP